MYNDKSKTKNHNAFNRSVYFAINKCNFIPNCAYEKDYMIERLPNGGVVRIYISDNGQYMRSVYYKTSKCVVGCCGFLFNSNTGEIVWGETNPADRGKSIYKQLKAITTLLTKKRFYSQFQTNDLLKAASLPANNKA